MITSSTRKFGSTGLAAAAAIVALWLATSLAGAGNASVTLASATTGVGSQATIALNAFDVNAPGLGAWTIDLTYDSDIVSPVECEAFQGGLCNPEYAPATLRVVGVSTFGIVGNSPLAAIVFACNQQGATEVEVTLNVFADATPGEPTEIGAAVQNGVVTCTTGGPAPTPTPTTGPVDALDGDVNCDGLVNSVDAALLLQFGAGFIDELPCPRNGDINGDGQANAVDASIILQIVAGFF